MTRYDEFLQGAIARYVAAGKPAPPRDAVVALYEKMVAAGKIPRMPGDPALAPAPSPSMPTAAEGGGTLQVTPRVPPAPPAGPVIPGPAPAPMPSEEEEGARVAQSGDNARALEMIQRPGFDREQVLRLYNGLGADVKGHGLSYLHIKRIMNLQQFFTPLEVTTLMAAMLAIPRKASVMDQTCGPGRMFWNVPTQALCHGIEFDAAGYSVASAVYPEGNIINDDASGHMWEEAFDYFLINPPFSLRWDDYRRIFHVSGKGGRMLSHYATMEQAIRGLKPGGYVAAVLPNGFWDRERLETFKNWVRRQAKWVAHVVLPTSTHVIKGDTIAKGSRWQVEIFIWKKFTEPLPEGALPPESEELETSPPFRATAASFADLSGVLEAWKNHMYYKDVMDYSNSRETTTPVRVEKVDRYQAEEVRLLGRGLKAGPGDIISADIGEDAMPRAYSDDRMTLAPKDKLAALKLAHAASYWPNKVWDYVERTWASPFQRDALIVGRLWSGDMAFDEHPVVEKLNRLGVRVVPTAKFAEFMRTKREWFILQNTPFDHTANPTGKPDGWTMFNATDALERKFPEVWAQAEAAFDRASKTLPWMKVLSMCPDGRERQLFPFQQYDVKRMTPRAAVIYGAGMGTGKTLTSIATAQAKLDYIQMTEKRKGRVLFVVPPKLVDDTWQATFEKEAGIGKVPELVPEDFKNPAKKIGDSQWVIVSYNTLSKNMGISAWKEVIVSKMDVLIRKMTHALEDAPAGDAMQKAYEPVIIQTAWSDVLREKNVPLIWANKFLKPILAAIKLKMSPDGDKGKALSEITDKVQRALSKEDADDAEENPRLGNDPEDDDPLGRPHSWFDEVEATARENPAPDKKKQIAVEDEEVVARSQWPWFSACIANMFDVVVIDEAHAIHKRNLQLPLALRRMMVSNWVALTGTPIKNRPKGLYALMEVMWRSGTASLPYTPAEFFDEFVTVLYENPEEGKSTTDKKLADTLWESEDIRPIELPIVANPLNFIMVTETKIIRRTKNEPDVQPEVRIPDPVLEFENISPDPDSLTLYKEVMERFKDIWMRKIELERAAQGREAPTGRTSVVLALIGVLRQLSAMPQFRPKADDPDIQSIVDTLPAYKGTFSAKQRKALDYMEAQAKAGEKVIFIAETIPTVHWFEKELTKRGVLALAFTSETGGPAKRAREIAQWRTREGGAVVLATIKVMDTGLNIPQAKTTIIYEPSWNYADMEQAWSRMLRARSSAGKYTVRVLMNRGMIDAYVWQIADYKRMATGEVMDRLEVPEYPPYYGWRDIMSKQMVEMGVMTPEEAESFRVQSFSLSKEKEGKVSAVKTVKQYKPGVGWVTVRDEPREQVIY